MAMAYTVSFINFKGGVGKTTLCVEIAASLAARQNAKVLIIDLDPQTNATFSLITENECENIAQSKHTLRDFFQDAYDGLEPSLDDLVIQYDKSYNGENIYIVPSHLELFGMDLQIAQKYGHDNLAAKSFLKDAIKRMKQDFDFIFIDCPPNLYLATQNGLFASDSYVIVALPEYLSTLGLFHIQKSINGIFERADKAARAWGGGVTSPELLGIIFNRVRYSSGGTADEEAVMTRFRAVYGGAIFENFVSQSTEIATRSQQKIPVALSGYAKDRKYENQMRAVATEFYDRITAP